MFLILLVKSLDLGFFSKTGRFFWACFHRPVCSFLSQDLATLELFSVFLHPHLEKLGFYLSLACLQLLLMLSVVLHLCLVPVVALFLVTCLLTINCLHLIFVLCLVVVF